MYEFVLVKMLPAAPTLTVAQAPADNVALPASGKVTFTFTSTGTLGTDGFVAGDIDVTNGTASGFAKATTPANTYTVDVTPDAENGQPKSVTVTVAKGAVEDIYGNKTTVATTETWTSPDIIKPTLAITYTPGDDAALRTGNLVDFTFTFSEVLGTGDAAFTKEDITVPTGTVLGALTKTGNAYAAVIQVTDPTKDVVVTVAKDAVKDTSLLVGGPNGLAMDATATKKLAVAPTVGITHTPLDGVLVGDTKTVTFTFTFSETLGSGAGAFTEDDVMVSAGTKGTVTQGTDDTATTDVDESLVYTLPVTLTDVYKDVKVDIAASNVEDAAGNALATAATETYTAPKQLTVAIAHTPADGTKVGTDKTVTFTFTFSEALGTGDAAFAKEDITVSANGTAGDVTQGTDDSDTTDVDESLIYTLPVTLTDVYTDVMVSVATTAVTDAAGNALAAAATETYTAPTAPPADPDGTITLQPGYTVVVRNPNSNAAGAEGVDFTLAGTNVTTATWAGMPDLEALFDTDNPAHGKALIVKAAPDQTITTGSVGINEIMWAIDTSYYPTPAALKASQWIELNNLNSEAVKVQLSTNTDATGAIDSVLNKDGNNKWKVPGTSGNSVDGTADFASMYRILPGGKADYADADGARYNNRPGNKAGHWKASTGVYGRFRTDKGKFYYYKGSPGSKNSSLAAAGKSTVPSSPIVINEVGNHTNNMYDWIELKNVSGAEVNLRNYMISIVRAKDSDVPLIQFDNNDNAKVGAGKLILLVASDPADNGNQNHPIAPGRNVDTGTVQRGGTANSPVQYKVFSGGARGTLTLPNDDGGKFVLIVRKPDNLEGHRSGQDGGKGVAETGNADLDKIVDIAGYEDSSVAKSAYPNPASSTNLWPLYQFNAPKFSNNAFVAGTVHQRNRVGTNKGASGAGADDDNNGKSAFGDIGFTGIGYKRMAAQTAANGGTPGYDKDALKSNGNDVIVPVYISEIMYADHKGTLPQWIELRNSSKTHGANLHDWQLIITNHADSMMHEDDGWAGKASATIWLRNLKIKPNSAVLITTRKGPRSDVYLPDADIFVLWPTHKDAFGMKTAGDDVLNPYGFKIVLRAKAGNAWQPVDMVSNLSTETADNRTNPNPERFDKPRWAWPTAVEDSVRSSVVRVNNARSNSNVLTKASDGSKQGAWILSGDHKKHELTDVTYYGHKDDISTPGQTYGQPLPVELSSFRPTLEDGKVVVRWTTESELDNAGFNIYRSETRDGEFKQINAQLIQGAGTTGERNTYEWVDTTAKPDVVYYYQIEDVSFAGERQTLATNRLRGYVSAENKLTTRWGELKSQD